MSYLLPLALLIAQTVSPPGTPAIPPPMTPQTAPQNAAPAATFEPAQLPLCLANQLSLAVDNESGAFNGMNQSGTLLVLRNLAPTACRVPPLPALTFRDATDNELPILVTVAGAIGMHPGPVVLPIPLAPSAELTATLHWVAGEVYDHTICVTPTQIAIQIGDATLHTQFTGHICGPDPTHVKVTRTRLTPDPIFKP